MNFLKKNYKIIIYISLILLFIVGGCLILFNKKSEKCEIITFKNDYYVVNSDKNNYINVPLYVSVKDSILIDKEYTDEDHFEVFEEIHKHLHKFGFILRYPKGKEHITGFKYEPWHYRYVGVKHATNIYNKNITLEEYIRNLE